ncbi:unnamed protein product [Porites evermanni]|uniref:Uncharacterized protein n=1 Tax=Porites evermanni TaxID=104178 RepID=A0ABN8RSB2_9CNID|nr:unnamed protein product [Porites evermanni]
MEPRSRETTPTREDLDFIVDDGYRHDVDPDYVPDEKYLVKNIIFNEPKEYKVKDSKIKYKRIRIAVKYSNGKKGAVVIETPVLFSFGVNEKKNQETNKLVGYSMPVCLWAKGSEPNTKEKAFFDVINNITTASQQYLESEYGADLASTLSSPLYFKQEEYMDKKGKKKTRIDPSSAPVLYAKLIYSEKSKKILSLFKTKGKKDLNPFKYINQYCNVKMALIVEGIFISKTVTSLQIKVHECYVKPLKPRESLLTIEEEESEGEEITDQVIEDLLSSDKEENE